MGGEAPAVTFGASKRARKAGSSSSTRFALASLASCR